MAYITLANSNKIIFGSDLKKLDLSGEIYKIPIYFYSKYEINELLAIQELLKDPENYFNYIYIPIESNDTYTLIYEGKKPCYHDNPNCERLNSDYQNFEIPQEICDQGPSKVHEFRSWFESVKHLLPYRPDAFVMHLQTKWGIVTNPRAMSRENSGITNIENYSLDEVETKIDSLIKDAGRFYYKSSKNTKILKKYSKYSFLAKDTSRLYDNNTGFSDNDVKSLLKEYETTFKKPLKKLLIEYYRLKFNPEIEMDGYLLEKLGFVRCGHCSKTTSSNNSSIKWLEA